MSRSLTSITRQALNAPETGEVFLILLTLSHTSLGVPIRVTSDNVTTVSRGNSFIPFAFDLTLPDDQENANPRAKLVIDNVDRSIVAALRSIATAPTETIEVIRAADPDVVEARFLDFKLTNVTYDSQRVEGDLTIEDFTAEPYPAGLFTPNSFPALF